MQWSAKHANTNIVMSFVFKHKLMVQLMSNTEEVTHNVITLKTITKLSFTIVKQF